MHPLPLQPHSQPPLHPTPWSSQSTQLNPLCYIAASHKLSVLHMVVCICQHWRKEAISIKGGGNNLSLTEQRIHDKPTLFEHQLYARHPSTLQREQTIHLQGDQSAHNLCPNKDLLVDRLTTNRKYNAKWFTPKKKASRIISWRE